MPEGLIHQKTGAEEHWNNIRANLKPIMFEPTKPVVFLELTSSEEMDTDRFLVMRSKAIKEHEAAMKIYRTKLEACSRSSM